MHDGQIPIGRRSTQPDLLRPYWNGVVSTNTDGTARSVKMDYTALEEKVLAGMLEGRIPFPFKIQVMDMLPEKDADGNPFILDGGVMRSWYPGIWGDWVMHSNTFKLLKGVFFK